MRLVFLLVVALTAVAVACRPGSGGTTAETVSASPESSAPGTELPLTPPSLWSPDAVIDEIALQLFKQASRPVHIFGLNVEEGEEFVPSGRDVLPLPPNTLGWAAEFEGDGVWIVDTGELIYRFAEADAGFSVIYEYAGN